MLFIWLLAPNATYSMLGLLLHYSKLDFEIIKRLKTKKKTCEVAIHLNAIPHQYFDFQFICIEKIIDQNNLESKLITREAYWTVQLRTLRPC